MRAIRWTSRAAVLIVGIAMADGCHQRGRQYARPTIPLEVHNYGFFDVVVYALRSEAGSRIRLATVSGNSSARLSVAETSLQPGGVLRLYLHAIGSTRSWASPAVSVSSGTVACLDIYSDRDGNLSRSVFYTSTSEEESVERALSVRATERASRSGSARTYVCGG